MSDAVSNADQRLAADPSSPTSRALPPLVHYAKATAVVIAVAVFAVLLYQLRSVAMSIFLGFFIAVGSEPFISWLQRRGLRRGAAVGSFVLGALVVLAGVFALLLYPAIQQTGQLVQSVPELLDQATEHAERFGIRLDDPAVKERAQGILEGLPSVLSGSLGAVYGLLGGLVSAVFTTFTVIALAIYFMIELPRMQAFAAKALNRPERVAVLEQSLAKVGAYVSGQLVISLTAGIVAGIALSILGVPYAAVLGVVVALLSTIPQVGALLGAVVCTVVALADGVPVAVFTLLFLVAYQQFENYVLAPRVFAKAVDLSPVAVFLAVLAGTGAAGAIGALTALPITAALKVVFRHVFRRRLREIDQTVLTDPDGEPEPDTDQAAEPTPDTAASPTSGPAVERG